METDDISVLKHLDAERMRYVEAYISDRKKPNGWVKSIYTWKKTDYERVYRERIGPPNYNTIEVTPAF